MPFTISPPVPSITINGHTYTNSNWEADTPGTISAIANDISTITAALSLVGTLVKTISGNTTLSGPESTNMLFVFKGSLSGDATITFAAGFQRMATIVNQTTGSHQLVCGLAAGATVTIPASGSQEIYCDGTDFAQADGIARTATGTKISGTASVAGAATITGAATLSSTVSVAGAATIAGAAALSSTLNVTGAATVGGAASVGGAFSAGNITGSGTASVSGAATIGGAASVAGAMTVGGSVSYLNSPSGEARYHVNAIAGQSAWVEFDTAGTERWLVGRNNTTEAGSDVGSDFDIVRSNDAGSPLGVPFRIRRSDGVIILAELPTSASGLPSAALYNDSGTLKVA